MSKARVVVLEGTWWSSHEVPLVLPFFHALAISQREIDLSHRTIRSLEDIAFYVSKIKKNARAFLYFACHAADLEFNLDGKSWVTMNDIIEALQNAKEGVVSFVHFGCCEMINPNDRRESHRRVLSACGAQWASGYTKSVDWFQSTFFDLALVSEVFVPHRVATDGRSFKLKNEAAVFLSKYEQAARQMGFSALAEVSSGQMLLPERMHP
jgi:hypothetical protein